MPLPNIIKIFKIIQKLLSAQELGLEIYSGEIKNKAKVVLLACNISI